MTSASPPPAAPKRKKKASGESRQAAARQAAQAHEAQAHEAALEEALEEADTELAPESAPAFDSKFDSEFDALTPESFGLRGTWAGRWHQLSRLPVTMMIASLLLGLGIIQMTFQLGNSAYRSVTWGRETQATLVRVQNLQRDVNILHAAEQASSDPAYLEQLARCQGYVSTSEQVVVATSAPTTPPGESCAVVRLP